MLGFRSKQKRRVSRPRAASNHHLSGEVKRGIITVVLFAVSLFGILSFFGAAGSAGASLTGVLGRFFGWGDWTVPALLLVMSYFLLRSEIASVRIPTLIGFVLILISYHGLLHLGVRSVPLEDIVAESRGGGYLGYYVGGFLYGKTAFFGSFTILLAALIIGLFMFFNISFTTLAALRQRIEEGIAKARLRRELKHIDEDDTELPPSAAETRRGDDNGPQTDVADATDEPGLSSNDAILTNDHDDGRPFRVTQKQVQPRRKAPTTIDIPIDLLTVSGETPSSGDIKAGMKKIETTLQSFGIEVVMGDVNVGPTVTQYTLKPTEGIKLNQITALHQDLALSLAAHPIRIEAPIPGKSLVGIEVPNQTVSIVKLREVLESSVFKTRKSSLMMALGKDVTGKVIFADLAKMPHLLIAGATGSGKSVSINSILVGLLYQNSPDMLKMILIDPKRVELASYDGLPHLLTPVITESDKTINALRWAVEQMDERYRILSRSGKKNISSYNEARLVDKMPYIVIVIDELADLMMIAAKEVESAIIRLAQMARAVGVHLILSTQRPSVNVITGLIKANITSRVAFAVASSTDSRTIIDSSGAEKLLGHGDMLYISAELSRPRRIQGCLVSEEEIERVTAYVKERGEPEYNPEVVERRPSAHMGGGKLVEQDINDIREAAQVVVRTGRASATLLQSRMRVGFAKASRILDILEHHDIIGPQLSSKPREVLISFDEIESHLTSPQKKELEEDVEEENDPEDQTEAFDDDEATSNDDDNPFQKEGR